MVDGGSRDGTRELAARLGARVVERPFDDFARQHEFARTQARGEWILSIDADERASPELAAAAPGALRGAASAYALPFKNHFRGVWLRHGGFWPDRHVRLFRKDRCRYDPERPVHEKLLVDGATARLDAPVLHHTWGSLAHCLAKMERYGERAAQALFAQGRRAAAWEVALRQFHRAVYAYVSRGRERRFVQSPHAGPLVGGRIDITRTLQLRARGLGHLIAFDKNDPVANSTLVAAVSKIVQDMHADGTLSSLSEKWYKTDLTTQSASSG